MAESTNQTTVIGADTQIKGEMAFDQTAKILGKFEGRITAKGELQIADGATCQAAVEANRVTVDGKVDGDMLARDRVQLNASASMRGDLVATKLVVQEGATLIGQVTVGPDAMKGKSSVPSATESKPQVQIPTKGDASRKP